MHAKYWKMGIFILKDRRAAWRHCTRDNKNMPVEKEVEAWLSPRWPYPAPPPRQEAASSCAAWENLVTSNREHRAWCCPNLGRLSVPWAVHDTVGRLGHHTVSRQVGWIFVVSWVLVARCQRTGEEGERLWIRWLEEGRRRRQWGRGRGLGLGGPGRGQQQSQAEGHLYNLGQKLYHFCCGVKGLKYNGN